MRTRKPIQKQDAVVVVRMFREEKATLKKLAKADKKTVSELVRGLTHLVMGGMPRVSDVVEVGVNLSEVPDYPKDGSIGPREGGFMWGGRECPKRCTCALCTPWRKKLGRRV